MISSMLSRINPAFRSAKPLRSVESLQSSGSLTTGPRDALELALAMLYHNMCKLKEIAGPTGEKLGTRGRRDTGVQLRKSELHADVALFGG